MLYCHGYRCWKRVPEKVRSGGFLCLGQDDISRNCQKSKRCFYCKGLHNSATSENKITKKYMTENSEISKLTSANFYCVSLQTAEIILVNLVNKIEIIAKTLFDQGSQRNYITE